MPRVDAADMIDSALKKDPTETKEAKEPIEPTENAELIEPMLMNEFFEAMLKAEFREPMLQRELCALPMSGMRLPSSNPACGHHAALPGSRKYYRKWRHHP